MFKWIKRFILFFMVLLVIIITAATINTYSKLSRQPANVASVPAISGKDSVLTRLSEAIKIRTVTYDHPELTDTNTFLLFHQFLKKNFPLVHGKLTLEKINGFSLLYKWEGKKKELKPIVLMAHQDVVPAEDSAYWHHPPFSGIRSGGFIWGRGTLDIKSGVLGILEGAEMLLREGFQPERTIYFAFGHNEESTGKGAEAIAALMQKRGIKPDFVMDEGGIILKNALPGLEKPAAFIGIAEKGFMNVKLTAKTEGGHSSMPPQETAVTKLAAAIIRIKENPFPAFLNLPAKQMFEYIAPEMNFPFNILFSNSWLTEKIIVSQMTRQPSSNAAVRTTLSVNKLSAGVKINILPHEAVATANLRIMPGTTKEEVKSHLEKAIRDKNIKVEILEPFQPASPVSSTDSEGFRQIQVAVKSVFPEAVTAPFQLVAITDSRHFVGISDNIYRFHPAVYDKSDLSRLHGRNERISEENYLKTIQFYYVIIKSLKIKV
jgi:carboxypeptidase PM20D1